ncbi:MAG: hypothetical protein WCO79_01460 [bacterium]
MSVKLNKKQRKKTQKTTATQKRNSEIQKRMKKSSLCLLSLVLIALIATSALAGQSVRPAPPNLGMIKSAALLWSYADSQATEGNFQAYGDTVLNDWGRTMVTAKLLSPESETFVGDAEKVLALINEQSLYFRVSSAIGKFYYYGSINNAKGRQLFYTGGETKLVPDRYGDYELADNARYSVWGLVPVVPIAFDGLQSAKVVVQDASGNVQTSPLEVNDGYLMFPTNLVDRAGDLILTRTVEGQEQPETLAYDLHTAKPKPLSYVYGASRGQLEKLFKMNIQSGEPSWKFDGWGIGNTDFVLIFDVQSPRSDLWSLEVNKLNDANGQVAVGVVVRSAADSGFEKAVYLPFDEKNNFSNPVKIGLPEGKWHVIPIWPSDPYRYLYLQWWGGGKG